ncbi:MAG: radical SAM protein [PVC group bacterium]|nr:radical SAM protein [PVC group bacterium]
MLAEIHSQINNLITFRRLFSVSQLANKVFNAPITVNLLITSQCNLRCKLCSTKDALSNGENDLTKDQLSGFIKTMRDYRPVIFIGGGEPFMRRDIFEIIEEIKQCGLRYGIVTNSTILDQAKISKLLKDIPPEVLIFSSYGGREDLHEGVTGLPGSFSKLCKNIGYALKERKKTKVILNCVINEQNYASLEESVLLGKRLGVDQVRFEHLVFLTDNEYKRHTEFCKDKFLDNEGEMTTSIQNLDNREMGDVLGKIIPELQKKYRSFVLFKPYLNNKELSQWYNSGFRNHRKCLFIQNCIFIKHNGDVVPCQFFSDYVLGNINNDNLIDLWRGQKRRAFNQILKNGLLPGCTRCCKL